MSVLTKKQRIVSFVLCYNLRELTETCIATLNELPHEKKKELPNATVLKIGMDMLDSSFPDFVDDDGDVNHKNVNDFCKRENNLWLSELIYKNLKEGLTPSIFKSIESRDEDYFIDNFDSLVSTLPIESFSKQFNQIKKFISNRDAIPKEDKEIIWEFFEVIGRIVLNEDEEIEKLFENL